MYFSVRVVNSLRSVIRLYTFRQSFARKDIRLNLFHSVIPVPPLAEGNLIPCTSVLSVVRPFHFGDFLAPLAEFM